LGPLAIHERWRRWRNHSPFCCIAGAGWLGPQFQRRRRATTASSHGTARARAHSVWQRAHDGLRIIAGRRHGLRTLLSSWLDALSAHLPAFDTRACRCSGAAQSQRARWTCSRGDGSRHSRIRTLCSKKPVTALPLLAGPRYALYKLPQSHVRADLLRAARSHSCRQAGVSRCIRAFFCTDYTANSRAHTHAARQYALAVQGAFRRLQNHSACIVFRVRSPKVRHRERPRPAAPAWTNSTLATLCH
jgi:hypothetical protein